MAATLSAAFNARTHYINILSDAVVYIAVGVAPTATTTIGGNGKSMRIPADVEKSIAVQPGWKLSAITSTGTASVQIEELSGGFQDNPNQPGQVTVQLVSATT